MTVPVPPLTPGAGPRPIRTREDVLAFFPDWIANVEGEAPVRDSLADALLGFLLAWQAASDYGIAQSDYLRAVGSYLSELGLERGFAQQEGEETEAYRARLFATAQVVTEDAIRIGVNAILAPVTDVECQIFDGVLDRWYVRRADSTARWRSYVGANPEYHARLYEQDASFHDGQYRPNSNPGGARVYRDHKGRIFTIRVPDLRPLLDSPTGPFARTAAPSGTRGVSFWTRTTSDPVTSYVRRGTRDVTALYRAIEDYVNGVVGASIRWTMFAEIPA